MFNISYIARQSYNIIEGLFNKCYSSGSRDSSTWICIMRCDFCLTWNMEFKECLDANLKMNAGLAYLLADFDSTAQTTCIQSADRKVHENVADRCPEWVVPCNFIFKGQGSWSIVSISGTDTSCIRDQQTVSGHYHQQSLRPCS